VWAHCHCCALPLSDFTFSTAEAFLREAAAAKQSKRDAIAASIAPHLSDHGTVGIPPKLHKSIEKLLETYGDETYRQVALFALAKWFEAHTEAAEDLFNMGQMPEAVACMMDATRISDSLHLVCEVGSLGGDQDWKIMLEEELSQAILEHIEEEL
jgi:hypothetical protein